MVVAAYDWADIRHVSADRCGEVMMIAKGAIGRIDADPPCAGQVGLDPCVQCAFGTLLAIAEFAEITTSITRREADPAQCGYEEHRKIATSPAPKLYRLLCRAGAPLLPSFVRNLPVE